VAIEVSAEGLLTAAARCEQHGASLAAVTPPSTAGTFEPSVAAVRAAHAAVVAAGDRLGARMVSTATLLASAAQGYATTDEDNAGQIASVGAAITAV